MLYLFRMNEIIKNEMKFELDIRINIQNCKMKDAYKTIAS